MTSVRKRKMARSSVKKNSRRTKDKQRNVKIYSNPIIMENWDDSLTLQQNYKRLGLRAKLGHIAGGIEKDIYRKTTEEEQDSKVTPEVISDTDDPTQIPEGEARIIRDPESNEVIKVIYGTMKAQAVEKPQAESSIIAQLEEKAKKHASIVKERSQSERESDWLKSLYDKYGDDYNKMMWDKKLNIYQQSAGDLKRRINKWKKANKIQ